MMRGAGWSGEPRAGRYRLVVVKWLAGVLGLALAALSFTACSSGSSGGEAAPTTGGVTIPTVTIPIQTTTTTGLHGAVVAPVSTCSQADLDGPILKMPTPRIVNAPVSFKQYGARLVPAEEGPRISATSAWFDAARLAPIRGKSAELLFGTFRASIPFGPHGPQNLNVHAWVLSVHQLVYKYPSDVAKTSPCIFADAYFVIDAYDGNTLLVAY